MEDQSAVWWKYSMRDCSNMADTGTNNSSGEPNMQNTPTIIVTSVEDITEEIRKQADEAKEKANEFFKSKWYFVRLLKLV